ncbi:MAG: gliding motility protein RemB [Flavobacteriaceae bacterium]|nr:gliding motility protein RemB [Flavobacteriaceae bacterium]
MKKSLLLLTFLFTLHIVSAQIEKPPVYKGCENENIQNLETCFSNHLKTDILKEFNVPEIVSKENYRGQLKVVFLVTKKGSFEILYINAMYAELENEIKRVFSTLPTVQPATYNSRAVDMRYVMPIAIPLNENSFAQNITQESYETVAVKDDIQETVIQNQSLFPEFSSELNIPLTHQGYDEVTYYLNLGENTHTASKPYLYNEVKSYVDLEAKRTSILKDKKTWAGRKLFNEHLALVKGKNYWFTVNPVWDLQLGKDNSDVDYTFNNTRGLQINGSLGGKFSFSTSFYESQGRFAEYVNKETRRLNPIIGASAVVPGRGKAKSFKEGGFDYPVAEAYLSYTPNEFFNFQFGNGKNFIGDGYRSFFLSDVASPYPFFKISTQFWKIKYTNLWMWMDDIRRVTSDDGTNFRKYVAMHHLSWNVTDKFNIGLFESVITNQDSYDGFDVSFFNPIIFYRAVEFSNGGDLSGNVQIGLNLKYKLNDHISFYNQFLIDEMTVDRVFDNSGYWGNKFALQFGAKYFNAFKVDNLMLQGEFNWARPYTFSHGSVGLNSGHYNQAISHLWGANFWEVIGVARYSKNRWFANAKMIVGEKGFDFAGSDISYGGDIYVSYNDRVSDTGNEVAQGNSTSIFIGDIQGGYVLNPTTNLQLFGGFTYRNFAPGIDDSVASENNTTWFTIGLKSDIFNWYFDF